MPPQFLVDCPQCSRQLRLPSDVLGKAVKCPLCHTAFDPRETAGGATKGSPLDLPLAPHNSPPPHNPQAAPDRGRAGVPFAVLVHTDPESKLSGRFDAAIDKKGMRLWRGRGRVLEVPADAKVKPLEGVRLVVPLEGRDVELSVIEPFGRSR